MPGRVHGAVVGYHDDGIEPLGAAQRIDRLLRRLRDGTRDVEGRVDG